METGDGSLGGWEGGESMNRSIRRHRLRKIKRLTNKKADAGAVRDEVGDSTRRSIKKSTKTYLKNDKRGPLEDRSAEDRQKVGPGDGNRRGEISRGTSPND